MVRQHHRPAQRGHGPLPQAGEDLTQALAWIFGAALAALTSDVQNGYSLSVPAGFVSRADRPTGVLLWAENGSETLIVSKVLGPTDWARTSAERLTQVEAGLKNRGAGYERLSARPRVLGKKRVPACDLWFRVIRDGQPRVVGARFLFFRTYALSLTAEGKHAKALLASFLPL